MQFPGTNCEFETLVAVKEVGMAGELFRWNRPAGELSGFDGFVIPGGFSYQDRVRAGVIASKEPVLAALKEEAARASPSSASAMVPDPGGDRTPARIGKVDMALARMWMVSNGNIVAGLLLRLGLPQHDASSRVQRSS